MTPEQERILHKVHETTSEIKPLMEQSIEFLKSHDVRIRGVEQGVGKLEVRSDHVERNLDGLAQKVRAHEKDAALHAAPERGDGPQEVGLVLAAWTWLFENWNGLAIAFACVFSALTFLMRVADRGVARAVSIGTEIVQGVQK